ncbi:hypothetical protein [Streptomyces sp. NBC_00448]|uniref:hypothetical protein n=1 Tax=Streptomyces sp. NBC_00448 TaxID=2903652 RepID=UPI002E20544C
MNDLFTVTGLPDDPLFPLSVVADALVVGAALVVVGAAAEVEGVEPASSDELESSLHAVSSAPPTSIAAMTGRLG